MRTAQISVAIVVGVYTAVALSGTTRAALRVAAEHVSLVGETTADIEPVVRGVVRGGVAHPVVGLRGVCRVWVRVSKGEGERETVREGDSERGTIRQPPPPPPPHRTIDGTNDGTLRTSSFRSGQRLYTSRVLGSLVLQADVGKYFPSTISGLLWRRTRSRWVVARTILQPSGSGTTKFIARVVVSTVDRCIT